MSFSILGMTVEPTMISVVVLAFTIGMCVPFKYGIERLRGFGRAGISKLPYKPPAEPEATVKGEDGQPRASDGKSQSK